MNALFFTNRKNLFALFVGAIAFVWLANNGTRQSPVNHLPVPEVDIAQAKALIDSGALVIDVRSAEQFAFRHLPGAVLVSLELLRAGIPPSIAAARDKPVVVYCNQGLLHGPEATRLLQQAGFTQAVNMRSGIEGWAAAGLPIKSG